MRHVILLSAAALVLILAGCTDDDGVFAPPQTGSITGVFRLDPDIAGSVANVRVDLYCSCENMQAMRPGISVLTDENGIYKFSGVCCGTYYVGAWKDNDGNSIVSSGDYLSDRQVPESCMCTVQSGNTQTVTGVLNVVP